MGEESILVSDEETLPENPLLATLKSLDQDLSMLTRCPSLALSSTINKLFFNNRFPAVKFMLGEDPEEIR